MDRSTSATTSAANFDEIVDEECGTDFLLPVPLSDPRCCTSASAPLLKCGGRMALFKLNLETIQEACRLLALDECMPAEVHQISEIAKPEELLPTLQFLDGCLVPKGRFKNYAREKSYSMFHQEFLKNSKPLADLIGPVSAPWLCMKVFDLMLNKCYDLPSQKSVSSAGCQVPTEEHDIVQYIGGFVIQGLKKQITKLSSIENKSEILSCLSALFYTENEEDDYHNQQCTSAKKSLTQLFDRGGLIKTKPNAAQIFLGLEETFRNLFGENLKETAKFEVFFEKACELEHVSTCFFDEVYGVKASEATKEAVLQNLAKLYFKVRINHKCRSYMDNHRKLLQKSKKEKGLRKTLKQ